MSKSLLKNNKFNNKMRNNNNNKMIATYTLV